MPNLFKPVLLTGLFVGTTDLVSAFIIQWIQTGKFVAKMLNYMAGGILGLDVSMSGGNAAAFLGLFIHYFISIFFTWLFFIMLPRVKFLAYNKWLMGMLYAVFVNVFMGQVAVRLSRLPSWGFDVSNSFISWVTLGIVFGIPIAYNAYKYYGIE
jgi:hypothetical protein